MKCSIITATYNSEQNIVDCINSVNNQTWNDIEHIFIDGDSTDKTVSKITKKSKKNFKLISEQDNGIYNALNKGINLMNGDFFCFLHSDDFYNNEYIIEKIANIFTENTEVNYVYANLTYVKKNNINKIFRKWKSNQYDKKKLKYGWMPPHPTLFIRIKKNNTFYKFNEDYKISSDYDFIIRHFLDANQNEIYYLDEFIYTMRLGGASNKSFKNILIKLKEDITIVKKYKLSVITVILKNITKLPQFLSINNKNII